MVDFSNMPLGCLAPHPLEVSKRVAFTAVFGDDLPAPSDTRDWTEGETTRPHFGNDRHGDCTWAAIANILVGALKTSFGKEWYPTTEEVLAEYFNMTGGADGGLVIEDVLRFVIGNGAFGHHFIGTAAIGTSDITNIKRAIDWCGAVDLGVALVDAWKTADSWTMGGYDHYLAQWRPGSWGRHCVCSEKYDAEFLYVWTWGKMIPVSWDAVKTYFETVDAVLTASWIKKGLSPDKLDLTTLQARMAEFGA